jgi:hypothetical protein
MINNTEIERYEGIYGSLPGVTESHQERRAV